MKGIFRKLFRYPLADTYMLLSFVLSFFALIFGMSIISAAFALDEDTRKYTYGSSVLVKLEISEQDKILPLNFWEDVTEGLQGIVTLQDVNVSSDFDGNMRLANIVLCANEPFCFPVTKRCETQEETLKKENNLQPEELYVEEARIVLGKQQTKISKEIDGVWYASINGGLYQVIAQVGLPSSELFDYVVLLSYSSLDQLTRERLNTGRSFSITLESNKCDVEVVYRKLEQNLEKYSYVELARSKVIRNAGYGIDVSQSSIYFILYAFCMINCIIAAEFWLWKRHGEVVVRKVLGATDGEIFKILYKQMLQIACCSLLICFLGEHFLKPYAEEFLEIRMMSLSMSNLFVLIVLLLFSCAIVILTLHRCVERMNPTEVLKMMGDE